MSLRTHIRLLGFAFLLTLLLGCAATSTRESTGQYVDDSAITTKVKAALLEEPNLRSMQISVETYKGVVQLSGFVNTGAMASKAADVARGVNGVRGVHNDLHVRSSQ